MPSKTCTKCGLPRAVDDFPPSSTRDGLSSWCRPCHREATAKWYADPANREKVEASRQLRNARRSKTTPTLEQLAERVARLEEKVE